MSNYTLIIDQGGHSTRAIVFNQKGEPRAYSSEPVDDALETPSADFIEYNIDNIIDTTARLLQRLLHQLPHKKILKIKSAAIIAQRSSIVACNKKGKPLTEMISWQDTRNATWLEQQKFDSLKLQTITGLRNNPHMGASKIRWLLDNNAEVQAHAKADNLMFIPWGAYFLQRLKQLALCIDDKDQTFDHSIKNSKFKSSNTEKKTIDFITDPILAARTGLVAYQECDWSDTLLTLYGIERSNLPTIVPSSYNYGDIKLNNIQIPIHLLGGDQNFIPCAYGNNNIKRTLYLNMGTGAFLQAYNKKNEKNSLLKTTIAQENNLSIEPEETTKSHTNNIFIIEGTVNAAATALDWWQERLSRPFSHAEIDRIIEQNNAAPLFINTLSGTGSPYWAAAKEPVFLSLERKDDYDETEKTLAVIESILFSCKLNIDIILTQNDEIDTIVISGGLSRSDAVCQAIADLSNISVTRYDDSEASARGALFYLSKKENYTPKKKSKKFNAISREDKRLRQRLRRFEMYKKEMESLNSKI